jgi:hypothetical protein
MVLMFTHCTICGSTEDPKELQVCWSMNNCGNTYCLECSGEETGLCKECAPIEEFSS